MLSKIYTICVFGLVANFLGAVIGAYLRLDVESVQYFQTEMVIWFFVIYLPLILISLILDAKKIIDIKYFLLSKHRRYLTFVLLLISFILGIYGHAIDFNQLFFWLMY
jgi:hypothetical protein